MKQSSLNDKIWDKMTEYEGEFLSPFEAADIAEKFVKEIALEFSMWLWRNRWWDFEDGKWRYTFEHGTSISKASYEKNFTKTNEELFNVYLKQKYK